MNDRWSAIDRLFHAALDRPPEARAGFLAEACGDDAELRREVQSLLDQITLTGFLEQPAVQVAAAFVTSDATAPLTGEQIGVYRVAELLGRGGMGEVYRARDTRLGREVALKVLPRALTGSPDRLARFEREARVLASLSHPHIGMLYGIEESGGSLALILELVEGDTLAERLARGPVPLKQALTWARQIADALDEAHQKGIVHRDLKPANIKITAAQEAIKVLDFGLARSFGSESDIGDLTRAPTITQQGAAIIGTAAYMSPEQARGEPVDKRCDVWAFGCVLYEMLTGQKAFAERTTTETLAAVLHREPDWTAIPPSTPASVVVLLRRCLDKDQRRRRRDIGDARAELEDAVVASRSGVAASEVSLRDPTRARLARRTVLITAAIVSVLALGGVTTWWLFFGSRSDTASPEARIKRITDAVGVEEMPAVSPDGKDVAFTARVDGYRQIWVRRLNGGQPLQITRDAVDHEHPRWLPDSSAIVYFTPPANEGDAGTLWEIPALVGTPRRLASAVTGADVSHDGKWLATMQRRNNHMLLALIARDGSTPGQLIPLEGGEGDGLDASAPRWSFDDRMIAFSIGQSGFNTEVIVIDVATRASRVVNRVRAVRGVAWVPDATGLVIASSLGSTVLYPAIFNLRTISLDGGHERQLTFGDVSYEQPDLDKAGHLFAVRTFMKSDIWRFPVTGSAEENVRNAVPITRQTGQVRTPSASPDGQEIAYLSDSGGHSNVWAVKVDGSESPRPLTPETEDRIAIGIPVWSPVNDWIVFIRDDGAPHATGGTEWLINREGSERRPLAEGASAAWSPDGQWVYFQRDTPSCIYKVRLTENASPERVRCEAAVPAVARDGTLYFVPHVFMNANEIYKAKPEGSDKPELVTRFPRSRVPLWPTGFALSPDDRWLAVPLTDHGTTNIWGIPTSGGPYRQITDFGRRPTLIARQVSWSRDGVFIYAALTEMDSDVVLLAGMPFGR